MLFTVLNWNLGGARFLETPTRGEREDQKKMMNAALRDLVSGQKPNQQPDVITLQEIVQYREPKRDDKVHEIIDEPPEGYTYHPFVLIDTKLVSSKAKWDKVFGMTDWDKDAYFAQGNAILVKKEARVFPVWDLSDLHQASNFSAVESPDANESDGERTDGTTKSHYIEHVRLDSGLYFGDRNTEPRGASVMHFILPDAKNDHPVDIFVVNVHLTTLMKEREGVPEVDSQAVRTRLWQLEIIFNGIVSRYNSWRIDEYPSRKEPHKVLPSETLERYSPVWILAGDFNFTEESEEYQYIERRNFIDTVEKKWGLLDGQKVEGTKAAGVGKPPSLTLDYVFAGPKFVSLDPMLELVGVSESKIIHEQEGMEHPPKNVSDHYPVLSTIDFQPRGLSKAKKGSNDR